MGYSSTSRDDLAARSAYRRATGSAFAHTSSMASTPSHLRTIHESVDPKKANSFGERVRECLDSEAHPVTLPVFVGFDETGSMGEAPMILQQKLAALKGALLRTGLTDAQLCFGAYGDAQNYSREVAPCQVGQFESGIEMEDWLNNLYLEGDGGGNDGETSGLLLYFMATHSRLDSVTKRGKKGYLILVGDESPLPRVTATEVAKYVGDKIQGDLSIQEVVAAASQLYDIYFFHLRTWAADRQRSLPVWQQLLGVDHVIPLEGIDTVSEQIAMLIACKEGLVGSIDQAADILVAEGADPDAVRRAGTAMVRFDQHVTSVIAATSSGNLPQPTDGRGKRRRL